MFARRSPSSRLISHSTVALALLALAAQSLAPTLALAQGAAPPPPAAPAPPAAPTAPAAAPAANPKTLLAAGDKAAKAKDWSTALAQYQGASSAAPSAQAQEGIANSEYNLKMQGEAYEAYDTLLKTYGKAIGGHSKATAEARLKELGPQTGYLSIRVNEAGANVQIDGKSVGTSPVAALIRVTQGPHKVDITKDTFTAVSQTPNVGSNGKEIVDVQLAHEATTGHLVVKEKNAAAVRVIVDGSDVGAAPLDVEVTPGVHEVLVRSSNMAAPSQQITVEKGKSVEVEMLAVAASAHLEITTSDRQGIIFLDGKPVAEGAFTGDIAIGPHTIAVTRDGFEKFEKTVTLADKQSAAETVTLKHVQAAQTEKVQEERTYTGIYGGFGLLGLIEPGGNGNELESSCNQNLGATSCTTPAPLGAGAMGYIGYSWNPVGIEGFVAGEFDETTPAATFTNAPSAGSNPLVAGVPRVEQFSIFRGGITGAVRARLTPWQSERFRLSLAAGFGVAYKEMELIRRAGANDGSLSAYNGGFSSYFTPALNFDASFSVRLGQTTALMFGFLMMIETAGNSVTSPLAPNEVLVSANPPIVHPLATPSYHYAQGVQDFMGPYIGMQFGP